MYEPVAANSSLAQPQTEPGAGSQEGLQARSSYGTKCSIRLLRLLRGITLHGPFIFPTVRTYGSDFLGALAEADRQIGQDAETLLGRPPEKTRHYEMLRLRGRDSVEVPLITRIAEFMATGQGVWHPELLDEINGRGESFQISFAHNGCFELKWLDEVPAGPDGEVDLETRDELSATTTLLAHAREEGFRIRRCLQDAQWFTPQSRAPRPKFCSVQCRNRFNYQLQQDTTFVCSLCNRELLINHFTGISQAMERSLLACHTDPNPVCIDCAVMRWPQWHRYLVDADQLATDSAKKHPPVHEPMKAIPLVYWQNVPSPEGV